VIFFNHAAWLRRVQVSPHNLRQLDCFIRAEASPQFCNDEGSEFCFSPLLPWSNANPAPIIMAPPGTTPLNPFLPSLMATITPNVTQDFSPLACFAIKGIDERNALDPLDPLAFNAGISFDKTGTVTVTQAPIPSPSPLPALGVGAALAWSRGLRRRVGKARSGHGALTNP
jgi:hypothetical protein